MFVPVSALTLVYRIVLVVSTSITIYYYGIARVAYVVRKSLTRWSTTLDSIVTLVSKRSFSTIVTDFEQEMIWDTSS